VLVANVRLLVLPSTPILQGFGACAAALFPTFRRTLISGFPSALRILQPLYIATPPCTAGCLQQPKGPLERQRTLRWEERPGVPQPSVAGQVRGVGLGSLKAGVSVRHDKSLRVTQSSLASQVWARLVCGDFSKAVLNEVEE